MPVNFQQAIQQIRAMGAQAPRLEEEMRQRRDDASALFEQFACELDTLQQLVDRASAENQHLRCAAPFQECLNAAIPAPPLEPCYTLLAADGSQINPDRHGMIEFGAINVGAIRVQPGRGRPPSEMVKSKLLFNRDLYMKDGGMLTDGVVALMRDIAERQELIELALNDEPPIVTLTDGTLEPFREAKGSAELEDLFDQYKQILHRLASHQVATAGYVDKPKSSLIIQLLELIILARQGELDKAGFVHPLMFVTDAFLFEKLLQPGERSAVFAIHSTSAKSFSEDLSIHFFYLNVGRPNHPYLSRVEIPRWVAETPRLLNLLHASLLSQAMQMGVRAYPYILHRAHEIAVVRFDEREQLENMIVAELRRQGVPVGERSHKQVAKDGQYT